MDETEVRGIIQKKILKLIEKLKEGTLTPKEELAVLKLGIWLLKDME
jgi:hypothetical protein